MEKVVHRPTADIYHEGMLSLAKCYAEAYQRDGRVFIGCFLKFNSVKSVCRSIVSVLKSDGSWAELGDQDFTEYCKRFENSEGLNDILKVIYYLTK